MKKIQKFLALLLSLTLVLGLAACGSKPQEPPQVEQPQAEKQPASPEQDPVEEAAPVIRPVKALERPRLLDLSQADPQAAAPRLAPYTVSPDLQEIINLDRFYLSAEQTKLLAENLFVVSGSYGNEFFEKYEDNRYFQVPNFVTVDSLMHTYHLYFGLLLRRTEQTYLAPALAELSETMVEQSLAQYDLLQGTAWEEAAAHNAAFFAVGARLLGLDAVLPEAAEALADQELRAIEDAAGIGTSALADSFMDYTQYIPRGYYAGDPVLEPYFKAMMWYGQVPFLQKEEQQNQSALLLTLALAQGPALWEQLYTVTAFFAGAGDDPGYYEYAPAVEAAYGALPKIAELPEREEEFQQFEALIRAMDPPRINSIPVTEDTENVEETIKGFRFMGQRFTVDAAIMQRLVYREVGENDQGQRRMLPDFLDVPAALGSLAAEDLLRQQGAMEFANYEKNLISLQEAAARVPDSTWSTSLYASWLYTLEPLLTPKGAGWPAFMNSAQWIRKNLETYAGSFTELKHDTVLYAKQMMAEMGGGPEEKIDDRGYVEPEPLVYSRFMTLARQTAQGLDRFGFLTEADRESLDRLGELAERLLTISQKELRDEVLTDEEYELIRGYGGTLEHFWRDAVKDQAREDFFGTQELPSSLVTDIATDPNGTVLQVATGHPSEIHVIVSVDGTLRIASGVVYDFYQFEQPMSQRLTDRAWRQMIGQWMNDDGVYQWDSHPEKPWWTQSYRAQ